MVDYMSYIGTSEFDYSIALGDVPGYETWNKFGYNDNISIGTEIVANFGGTWTPMVAAETMTVVSTSAADVAGSTGAASVLISGVDQTYSHVQELVSLTGLTPVVTTTEFRGINRVVIFLAGSGRVNAGDISVTSTTGTAIQALLIAGQGTTQQCIYHTSSDGTALMRTLTVNALKLSGGAAPKIIVRALVYSDVSKATYEVYRLDMDTAVENHMQLEQSIPFVVGMSSSIWFEVTSDKAGATCNLRFSFIEVDR